MDCNILLLTVGQHMLRKI